MRRDVFDQSMHTYIGRGCPRTVHLTFRGLDKRLAIINVGKKKRMKRLDEAHARTNMHMSFLRLVNV